MNISTKIDKNVLAILRQIGKAADARGINAFVVGGFVRDVFLRRPNSDIDVVVEGDAIEFAEMLARQKNLSIKAHQRFGTATIHGWDGFHIDCVSARSEKYPQSGSLPVVKRSSLKDDLFRRDFTINAIAVCVNKKSFGRVVDLYHGIEDLEKKNIRVFHDKSFTDDPTRMLRSIRFEQRFGFRLSARTKRLLKQAVQEQVYKTVSAPRFFQEFARGLAEEFPSKYLKRLRALGMLDFLCIKGVPEHRVFRQLDQYCSEKEISEDGEKRALYLSALFSMVSEKRLMELAVFFQWTKKDKKMAVDNMKKLKRLLPNQRLV